MAGAGLADRLFVVGFGHRTCPAALRERLFLDDSAVPGLLTALASVGVEQGLALSTCDRIEIHGLADRVGEATFDAVLGALAVAAGLPSADIAGLAYRQRGLAALRHLFAVACSLDSRTIGEPQVLGQLRAAHRIARDAGRVGAELETFLQTAYGTAKSVRGETAIAERPISMAAVAARLARDLHGDLARCGGILIGGEDIGELLVEQLMSAGLGRMTMVGRTRRGAAARAARLGCHFATIEELAQVLFEADVVVSSFGEGRHVLTGAMVEAVLRRRRHRPIFVIDVAVPSDVEPAVARLDEVFVYDLNDLERLAMEGRNSRAAATAPAWRIVDAALAAFQHGQAERQAVPIVTALRARFEQVRRDVLATGDGDLERATELLINRLLHEPSEELRALAAAPGGLDTQQAEALLRRLFRLEPLPPAGQATGGIGRDGGWNGDERS